MKTNADVTVIGAGVLGAAVAEECAKAGLRVICLDRGWPNREGSGTTAGNLHIQAIHPRRPGQEVPVDTMRLIPLQARASELWRELDERLDETIELRRNGSLVVAETPDQVEELERKHAAERRAGLETHLIDSQTIRQEFPYLGTTVSAADYCSEDGYVNPLLAVPALKASAERHGASFIFNATVSDIVATDRDFRVDYWGGSVTSGQLVLATGPWLTGSAALLGLNLDVNPVAIQMIVTDRQPPNSAPSLIQHIGEGLSLKQVHAGNILIGGGWPGGCFNDIGRQPISIESVQGSLAQVIRVVPAVRNMRVLRVWAGPLAAAGDEMPIAGPISALPGAYVVGGTYGITFAPLWARIIKEHILGGRPELEISDLGPDRLLKRPPEE